MSRFRIRPVAFEYSIPADTIQSGSSRETIKRREHASLRICRGRGKQVSDRIRCEHGVAVDQQHELRVLSERGGDSQVDSACESKISPRTQQTYVALAVAAIRAWFAFAIGANESKSVA